VRLIGLIFLFLNSQIAWAGDKFPYQNWTAEMSGRNNEAYTIADASTSFGTFCSGEQCLFYLHQGLNCAPGAKYSVLMNSLNVSTALTMECTLINGNLFQILTPFKTVLKATQAGERIGFAVALQSGAFAVSQFSLAGAKPAIERVLTEAANSKREQKQVQPPQILIIPPIQIVPNMPPNQAPNQTPSTPKKAPQKPDSKDIST
jgi:hypothetical protein